MKSKYINMFQIVILSFLALTISSAVIAAETTAKSTQNTKTKDITNAEDENGSKVIGQNALSASTMQTGAYIIEEEPTNYIPNPDPWEKFNRSMFNLNRGIDKVIIQPIAKTYDFIIPNPIQQRLNNFFDNINDVPTVLNDVLQGNGAQTLADVFRIAINSTVGLGGFFDVASKINLPKNHTDLGITLAKWGATNAPYIVIPFFGPFTFTDAVAFLPEYQFMTIWPQINNRTVRYSVLSFNLIRLRVNLLSGDKIINEAFDPYVLVRDAYLQHRHYLLEQSKKSYSKGQQAD